MDLCSAGSSSNTDKKKVVQPKAKWTADSPSGHTKHYVTLHRKLKHLQASKRSNIFNTLLIGRDSFQNTVKQSLIYNAISS